MIQLKVRTEFYFDRSAHIFGKIDSIADRLKVMEVSAAAITDCTTFGHVQWYNALKKRSIKPMLGAELAFTGLNERRHKMPVIARNNKGLEELYSLMSNKELTARDVQKSSANVIKFAGTVTDAKFLKALKAAYVDIDPMDHGINSEKLRVGLPAVITSHNYYPAMEDRGAFELFGGSVRMNPKQPQHLLSEREARVIFPYAPFNAAIANAKLIADACDVSLPRVENVKLAGDLEALCRAGIKKRGYTKKWNKVYEERLLHELSMIKMKDFADYFLVLSDLIVFAKKKMMVGPARGSSAGSIVCFLTYITDIDPIEYGLLFERFIDVTRSDLPDIDVDFPDEKREIVIQYLRDKYGADNVARIGTVQTWQPKSILTEVSIRMGIPKWDMDGLKNVMIERSSGDARAADTLLDTLTEMDEGRKMLTKYPAIKRATAFEGHAKYSGTHAAGVIICNDPVKRYCTLNAENVAQLDKKDAEKINLLKLDLLGLRTLSVIEDCINEIGGRRIDMLKVPLDYAPAFKLLNEARYAGIFQFEGDAVQLLTRYMGGNVDRFSDIVALGALARPGPLNSGGATTFVNRRIGKEPLEYFHKLIEPHTRETQGIIVYQEQVMTIGRDIGNLDWEDINQLRRAMSKSMGEEFFGKYWEKFAAGAAKLHGLSEKQSRVIWDNMQTMGSWSFNKSHAVAYGLISYWCAWLKANYPLQFAAATLRHSKNDDQPVQILREALRGGLKYVAFDRELSQVNWSVQKGILVGGFLNIKGVGDAKAAQFIKAREAGGFTDKQKEFLDKAEIAYAQVYEAEAKWGHLYENPRNGGFRFAKLHRINELSREEGATFAFIGQLRIKNPRDLNEYGFQVKRVAEGKNALIQGRPTQYMSLMIEDDTGKAFCNIGAQDYEMHGRPIVEEGVVDKSWYIAQGRRNKIGRINITWIKELK